jgi:hypothetical protein
MHPANDTQARLEQSLAQVGYKLLLARSLAEELGHEGTLSDLDAIQVEVSRVLTSEVRSNPARRIRSQHLPLH